MRILGQIIRAALSGRPAGRSQATEQTRQHEREVRHKATVLMRTQGFASALAQLQPVMDSATEAATFTAYGQLKLYTGDVQEALAWLLRSEALDARNPQTLLSLAQLYAHSGDPDRQYDCARRCLECAPSPTVDAIMEAVRALVDMSLASGQADDWEEDIQWLLGQWGKVAPAPGPDHVRLFAENLFSLGWHRQAREMLAGLMSAQEQGQCAQLALGPLAALQQQGRLDVLLDANADPLLRAAIIPNGAVLPGMQWLPWLPDRGLIVGDYATRKQRTVREVQGSQLLLHSPAAAWLMLPEGPQRVVSQPAVLLGSNANYYHHVIDHLSRLATLDALGVDTRDAVFIVGSPLLPFQQELLELLGIGSGRWLQAAPEDNLIFRRLIAPCPPLMGGVAFSPRIASWARRQLVEPRGIDGPPVRLYVSRSRAKLRRVVNEAELTQWLAHEGYTVIYPEDMTVAQQIDLYARASHVVAPGGAALTNMIFMPPGARVVMLNNAHLTPAAQKRFFDPLARASGLEFRIVSGQPARLNTNRILDADLDVPLAKLQQTLREWPPA